MSETSGYFGWVDGFWPTGGWPAPSRPRYRGRCAEWPPRRPAGGTTPRVSTPHLRKGFPAVATRPPRAGTGRRKKTARSASPPAPGNPVTPAAQSAAGPDDTASVTRASPDTTGHRRQLQPHSPH
ncbi:hypothetical protein BLA29_000017 [Euroglyphus maynei]|uniref:Uncharacterized protein n=1 Tax=Euroglyphus maynei TaxID=6958 RepID=A0A1Y3AXF0_EURMA|nr:hypothetical protein BLA29_000017 [Euroglyphus maynei]